MNEIDHSACPHCPRTPNELPLDEVLYQGFGGYHVEKDGEVYYWPSPELPWEKFKTLADIESEAQNTIDSNWLIVLDNPLRGASWLRTQDGWKLIETNLGFA